MIYTVGYEGASIDDFVQTLLEAGVEHVLDIRELPQSRRKGFSKNILAGHLRDAGLTYSHCKALGDPKEGRDAARRGEFERFKAIFQQHLQNEASQNALNEAAALVKAQATVLLCYERDPKYCHRAIVATKLSAISDLPLKHLGVRVGAGAGQAERRAA